MFSFCPLLLFLYSAEVWHAVLDLTLAVDPRTSPFFAAVSRSVDLTEPDGRVSCLATSEDLRHARQSAGGSHKDETSTAPSESEDTRWLSNAMRSVSGAASAGIPAHTAVDIVRTERSQPRLASPLV